MSRKCLTSQTRDGRWRRRLVSSLQLAPIPAFQGATSKRLLFQADRVRQHKLKIARSTGGGKTEEDFDSWLLLLIVNACSQAHCIKPSGFIHAMDPARASILRFADGGVLVPWSEKDCDNAFSALLLHTHLAGCLGLGEGSPGVGRCHFTGRTPR